MFIAFCSRCSHRTSPATSTVPPVGKRMPVSILIGIDLPAPFGPRWPTLSPSSIMKAMPSTARIVSCWCVTRVCTVENRPATGFVRVKS
jgi:hypothetical protein